MSSRVLIASNRLPITIATTDQNLTVSRSNGGLATALAATLDTHDTVWVGWAGINREITPDEIQRLAIPSNLCPIGLTEEQVHNYYEAFANRILWPLAHGLPAAVSFRRSIAQSVEAVIQKFADTIVREVQPDDVIWIHDYHLLYLPAELRRRGLKNRIGFFLHTPFWPPGYQIDLPAPRRIAANIAACDIFGVQTQRDVAAAQNFMQHHSLSAKNIKAFPIGVDFQSFDASNDDQKTNRLAQKLQKSFSDHTIIFSLSRLDYTKGILTQLDAVERLISQPNYAERIVYRINVAPSRELVPEYADLKIAIEERVNSINRRFRRDDAQPIVYSYKNIDVDEIAAWYQISDIHLNTPIADGMNLIAKEYIAARRSPGVVVISQTMGAAAQLEDALIVPPGDAAATARALEHALVMTDAEKSHRWGNLRKNVATHTVESWATTFVKVLKKSK